MTIIIIIVINIIINNYVLRCVNATIEFEVLKYQ